MKKLIIVVVLVSVVLAVILVPQCVKQFKTEEQTDNLTTTVSPNLTIAQRQALLEQRLDALSKVIDQLLRENAQLRRDLDALSR